MLEYGLSLLGVGSARRRSIAVVGCTIRQFSRPSRSLAVVEPTRWAVFRATAVYCVSRVINGAIPFLLLPIMTRYLTPFDYGVLSMFGVLVAVALPLVTLSLHGAVGVRYFDGDRAGLPNYVGNCFLVVLVATAGLSAMPWLFRGPGFGP
ncbi:MAG: hypothetical protein HY815_26425 [Candidatus Riflebacteria bacterium]|nr:hypothetical protein [Candidatus Riflebacteria bacterium]